MAVVLLASTEATVVAVDAIVEATPVVMGVIVTAELILGDCSEEALAGIKFCGGSGDREINITLPGDERGREEEEPGAQRNKQ